LCKEVGDILGAGSSAIVIATEAHLEALSRRLHAENIDVGLEVRRGRYIALDAAETLAAFDSDGLNETRFRNFIGGLIDRATAAANSGHPRVWAFGEVVALLWQQGRCQEALQLEEMWDRLAETHSFSLRCAYPMNYLSQNDGAFQIISELHTAVIPAERPKMTASSPLITQGRGPRLLASESEEPFRKLVESAQDYAIFMLDSEGYIRTWNSGAQRIKGYTASEIIGRHFSCFYPEEDIESGKPHRELEIAAAEGRLEDEGWRLRKDGSKFWANVIISVLRNADGGIYGFSKVTRDITDRMQAHELLRTTNELLRKEIGERKLVEQMLREAEKSLRTLSGRLFRIQDEERKHIGRELHDSIGQYLAALKMGLDALCSEPGLDAEFRRRIQEGILLAEHCIKDVRTMSYVLYPPMLEEMGLKVAIPWYLDGFTKRSGIKTKLLMSHEFCRLPHEYELTLFRVLQECLTNVHRHSGSLITRISIFMENEVAFLEVEDEGRGMPATVLDPSSTDIGSAGVGLRGMRERVRQIGGNLELSSTAKGTTVRATIPWGGSVART
jgi:PAS domain S-box-containing protein